MRKSFAPSQKNKFQSPTANIGFGGKEAEKLSHNTSNPFFNQRNHEFDSRNSAIKEVPTAEPELRIFSVVYGKQSKKKHKTWEGDGTLEVGDKNVTLKDENGKVIGQSNKSKTEELDEGSRLFVGSKEVEILELQVRGGETAAVDSLSKKRGQSPLNTSPSSCGRPVSDIDIDGPPMKKKTLSVPVNNASLLVNTPQALKPVKRNKFLKPTCDNFILPRPSEDHQWHFNEDHLPVTDVYIEGNLSKVLRAHQKEGVKFLYKCVTGLRSINNFGCILADEMGLGKTLQCISLIWTLLKQGPYGGRPVVKTVLIIVPSSLVKNWKNEFARWIGSYRINVFTVDKNTRLQDCPKNLQRPPVIIISYDMLVRNFDDVREIPIDLLICDEGHRLKNNNIKTTTLLNELPCKRRILLSGTPLQNDLQEFFTLVNFVNPGVLGSYADFRKKFEQPIVSSRELKSMDEEIIEGEKKAKELNSITSGFIMRRTQAVIGDFLPPKSDYVIFCSMSQLQTKLYKSIIDFWETKNETNDGDSIDHFSIITLLKKICNHPFLLKSISKTNLISLEENILFEISNFGNESFLSISTKFLIIESLIQVSLSLGEKIILVSNFTQTLDLLEMHCQNQSYHYYRFDGSTPLSTRNDIVNSFNSTNSIKNILLLSSKAGGVGLNLIGASRLVLIDSDWNPATDLQAMARIWREGQKKNVHIYRLLTSGTIEEKIFQRQLKKAGLSESVVDPKSVSSVKLSNEELKDIFTYQEADLCTTHDLLNCQCDGSGSIPGLPDCSEPEEVEEIRESEIFLSRNKENTAPSLRMNQLFLWQHHKKPISPNVLKVTGVEGAKDLINFIFINTTI